jgi:hypothetical protein
MWGQDSILRVDLGCPLGPALGRMQSGPQAASLPHSAAW